jgi:serine/threonine protein kinase
VPELGRYRLVEKLGGGGMGVVFRAIAAGPHGFERPFAVKRIIPHLARDPQFSEMLAAEARLCALLRHPNIVQVYELGVSDGEVFLAMEYVEGHDVARIFRHCRQLGRPVPVGVVLHVVREVASALAHAHALTDAGGKALSIVHRDVSPSNVMVTLDGAVKLVDFGIAKAASHVRDEQTRTGTLKGKLSYMSPEQADGLRVDHRTDLFSLGVVAYECLTLERLFRGDDDLHTLRLVRQAEVAPPSTLRPEIGGDVDAVVMRMLARDREARFGSGEEIVEALTPIVHRLHGDANAARKFLGELQLPPRGQAIEDAPPVMVATLPLAVVDPDATLPSPPRAGTFVTPPTPALPPETAPFAAPRRRWPWVAGTAGAVAGAALIAVLVSTRPTPNIPAAAPEPASQPEPQPVVTPLPTAATTPAATTPAATGTAAPGAAATGATATGATAPASRSAPRQPARATTAAAALRPRPQAQPAHGTVRIKVTPWADVRIDGKLVGTTPLAPRQLSAGAHDVTLTYRSRDGGSRIEHKRVVVRGDDDQLVEADLR